MDPFDVAQSFIELCQSEHPQTSRLTASLQETIVALGFRYYACCAHVDPLNPPPRAIMIHNYPEAWVQYYGNARLYNIDPVFRRAERDPMPFYWDTAFHAGSITAKQRKMMIEAADCGIAHGFTIPIHLSWLPGVRPASCSIVPESTAVRPDNYFAVEILVTTLYAVLNRELSPWRHTTGIKLSRRERQCIILAAQGKDDWAIGKLLNLSSQTVHFYMKRLMQKLGVATRVQAIAWALDKRQIFNDELPAIGNPRSVD